MATVSEIHTATEEDGRGASDADSALALARDEAGGYMDRPDRDLSRHPARVVSAKVTLRHRLKEIWRSRELLIFLVRSQLKIKYKNSVLGFLWSMLNPALVLAVYYVVFKFFLHNPMPDFALFLFAGLLGWNLFNTALMGASGAVVNNAGIVKKVAFPREVLALSQVGTAVVFFAFQSVVFVLFMVGFQITPAWKYLPLVLLGLVALIALTAALSIFLSAVNVYLRDTQHLIEVLLQAWFWGAPICYSFNLTASRGLRDHHILWLYMGDPIVPIVMTFQRALYGGVHYPGALPAYPESWYLIAVSIVLGVSLLVFLGAMRVFAHVEGNFAEEL